MWSYLVIQKCRCDNCELKIVKIGQFSFSDGYVTALCDPFVFEGRVSARSPRASSLGSDWGRLGHVTPERGMLDRGREGRLGPCRDSWLAWAASPWPRRCPVRVHNSADSPSLCNLSAPQRVSVSAETIKTLSLALNTYGRFDSSQITPQKIPLTTRLHRRRMRGEG